MRVLLSLYVYTHMSLCYLLLLILFSFFFFLFFIFFFFWHFQNGNGIVAFCSIFRSYSSSLFLLSFSAFRSLSFVILPLGVYGCWFGSEGKDGFALSLDRSFRSSSLLHLSSTLSRFVRRFNASPVEKSKNSLIDCRKIFHRNSGYGSLFISVFYFLLRQGKPFVLRAYFVDETKMLSNESF